MQLRSEAIHRLLSISIEVQLREEEGPLSKDEISTRHARRSSSNFSYYSLESNEYASVRLKHTRRRQFKQLAPHFT